MRSLSRPSTFSLRPAAIAVAVAAAALLLGAGCSLIPEPKLDPTRFYVLTLPGDGGAPGIIAEPRASLRVQLRTVALPDYLRDRSLVVRRGDNEIRLLDTARWAESLEAGLRRVLELQLVGTDSVADVTGRTAAPDSATITEQANLIVRILRCEGGYDADGRPVALFSAAYEIEREQAGELTRRRHLFVAPAQPWDGAEAASLVRALSQATAALADDIASKLQTAP